MENQNNCNDHYRFALYDQTYEDLHITTWAMKSTIMSMVGQKNMQQITNKYLTLFVELLNHKISTRYLHISLQPVQLKISVYVLYSSVTLLAKKLQ
jgi:hypothetical protein